MTDQLTICLKPNSKSDCRLSPNDAPKDFCKIYAIH